MTNRRALVLSGNQITESKLQIDDVTGLVTVLTTTPVNPDHLASKSYVDGLAGGLASAGDLATALAGKADAGDIAALQTALAGKAAQTVVTTNQTSIAALQTAVAALAPQSEISRLETEYVPNTRLVQTGGTGAASGKVPQLNSSGVIDVSMLAGWPVTARGGLDLTSATAPTPTGGSLYVATASGTVRSGYGSLTGTTVAKGDLVFTSGGAWEILATPTVTLDLDMGSF